MLETSADARALAERLDAVRHRIDAACQRAGRPSEAVTLVAVTKTFSVAAVVAARQLGLADFGENRVQELVEKAEALPGAVEGGAVRWHMIGHLQRNKARDVVAHADLFHALDSLRLAETLDTRSRDAGRVLPCLVQVNVSGEASKYGLDPDAVRPLLDQLEPLENLQVCGLMTLAAPTDDPETVRPQFRRLRRLFDACAAHPHVTMEHLSMGMSGDFEVAIEEGATHVRLGTALFGPRDR